MRKIPVIMATQHPDSAKKYIPVQKEVDEALESFSEGREEGLNFDEYKVDYEGKLTPYHQLAQIVTKLVSHGLNPGKTDFVTPRMPNVHEETLFRQVMVMMAAIEANYLVQDQLDHPAIVELIHPLTREAIDLIEAHERLRRLINMARRDLGVKLNPEDMQLIPLFEDTSTLTRVDEIIEKYLKKFPKLEYLRVFLGRSDPAMISGLIAAVLSVKLAISKLYKISNSIGLPIYPILGVGSLPFRGHLRPDNVDNVVREYSGFRTVTIQSALRYDYHRSDVKGIIRYLKNEVPKAEPLAFSKSEESQILQIVKIAEKAYRSKIIKVFGTISRISEFIPTQRDRLPPTEEIRYGRRVDGLKITLPRVIKMTAAFYSIGLPPEFIGVGEALKQMNPEQRRRLSEIYPSINIDLLYASRFLNLKVAKRFLEVSFVKSIEEEIRLAEKYLGLELLRNTDDEYLSLLLIAMEYLLALMKNPSTRLKGEAKRILCRLGVMRGALG